MALAQIHVFEDLPPGRAGQLVRAVHAALVEALHVPANDPSVWLDTHAAETSVIAERHGTGLVHVRVTMFAGRTAPTRDDVHRRICDRLVAAGVASHQVLVILEELPVASWSIAGQVQEESQLAFVVRR